MAVHILLHAPLQYTDEPAARVAQIDTAFDRSPDVLTFTEVQKLNQVLAIEARPGYDTFWGTGSAIVSQRNYAPISWRTARYRFVSGEAVVSSLGLLGEFPEKWFCRVVLEDLTNGERIAVVSGHMVPGIQSLGDETASVRQATIDAHAANVRTFRALMLKGGPTFGGTDANDTTLRSKIGGGIAITDLGATHRTGREIDYVLAAGGASITSARVVDGGLSDHDHILATIRTPKEAPVAYREAGALKVLLAEINAAAPNRSKASDGWIGDAAHAATNSDHNPWVKDAKGIGVVRARDFTNDPAGGLDGDRLAGRLAGLLGKHPALGAGAYVIWERRIISTNRLAEGWRPYDGLNAHLKHVHLSVGIAGYDATLPFGVMATERSTPRFDAGVEAIWDAMAPFKAAAADTGALAADRAVAEQVVVALREAAAVAQTVSTKH